MKRIGSFACLFLICQSARAEGIDMAGLAGAGDGSVSARIIQTMAVVTALSVAPGLLMMVTSFTRFTVALSFLRSGIGAQSTPANLVLVSLSLFMTLFVMAPTFDRAWKEGLDPLMRNEITNEQSYPRIAAPFRQFMLGQVREKDMSLFEDLARGRFNVSDRENIDFRLLIPAFMISELRRGFEIGFLIIMPFLVIDMIVATLTMSMGMMMLPPSVISLPVKVMFFVLMDGWNMLVGSLVRSVN